MSRRHLTPALMTAAVLALGLTGCSASSSSDARRTLDRYLVAWNHRDWAAMRPLLAGAPRAFMRDDARSLSALGVTRAHFSTERISQVAPGSTRALVAARLQLRGLGAWRTTTSVSVIKRGGRWLVDWAPSIVDPRLTVGGRLALVRSWPARGEILGAHGSPLTTDDPRVTVGVVGERIRDPTTVLADLLAAGAPSRDARTALAAARTHPDEFEPVFEISRARFERLRAAPGPDNVYAVAGTTFQTTGARHALTPQLATHIVGSVGAITAEQLHRLGRPYDALSIVGQTGLESTYERRLAGRPKTSIAALDASGARVATLKTFPGRPSHALRTSLDPTVQRAAEAALTGQSHGVAMVAMRASTGQILAAVSDPADRSFDAALQGAYPPGSTFKVLLSAALIAHGLSPSSPVGCPPTVTVDGEVFHNAEGDGPTQTLDGAFTESCNTSFIELALSHLRPRDLPITAARFGLKRTPSIGVPAFAANVTAPQGHNAMAAASIGQDTLTFSPLGMAMVAADVDDGSVLAPRLVAGAADDRIVARPLPPATVDGLRTMMAHVPETGTAAGTGLPPGTFAKTGTAQYQQDGDLGTDAWLMGYRGDIAFAIVFQDSGSIDGGPRDGPLIARFLDSIDAEGGR